MGDLVFEMPPELSYHLEHDVEEEPNYLNHDQSAYVAYRMEINPQSKAQVAGTETAYNGVPGRPTGALWIELVQRHDPQFKVNCEATSAEQSRSSPRFFTQVLDQPDRTTDHFEGLFDFDTGAWYSISSQISPYVLAQLRMSDNDLKGTTRAKIANM